MEQSKTQSDSIKSGDIVVLESQVATPGPYHKVGGSYRVSCIMKMGEGAGRDYVYMETLDGKHDNIATRIKRLRKI